MIKKKVQDKIETFSRELESREKNQIKILAWKNIKTQIKNSVDWFNRRLGTVNERISALEDRLAGNSLKETL